MRSPNTLIAGRPYCIISNPHRPHDCPHQAPPLLLTHNPTHLVPPQSELALVLLERPFSSLGIDRPRLEEQDVRLGTVDGVVLPPPCSAGPRWTSRRFNEQWQPSRIAAAHDVLAHSGITLDSAPEGAALGKMPRYPVQRLTQADCLGSPCIVSSSATTRTSLHRQMLLLNKDGKRSRSCNLSAPPRPGALDRYPPIRGVATIFG